MKLIMINLVVFILLLAACRGKFKCGECVIRLKSHIDQVNPLNDYQRKLINQTGDAPTNDEFLFKTSIWRAMYP